MKEQTTLDRNHESEGAKRAWAELKAQAAAGDAEAKARLERDHADESYTVDLSPISAKAAAGDAAAEAEVKKIREAVWMEYNTPPAK